MQRNNQIDVLRGVGIFLVVLGHNWLVLENKELMFRAIYAFHMPLFFFLSGIFLTKNESIATATKKKLSSIIKPYLSVCIIVSFIYWLAKPNIGPDIIWGILYGNGTTLIWPWLWFLPCLFVSSLFSICCIKATKNNSGAILALAFCLLLTASFVHTYISEWQPPIFHIFPGKDAKAAGLPLSLDLLPSASAWILLGHLVPKAYFSEPPSNLNTCAATLLLIGIHFAFDPFLDMNERTFQNATATNAATLVSIYLATELSKYIARLKISAALSNIGKASLFIYLFHFPLQAAFTFKLLKLAPNSPAIGYLAGLLAGIALPYLLYMARFKIGLVALLLVPKRARDA